MGSQLPRGQPSSPRLPKVMPQQPAAPALNLFTQGRAFRASRRPRRVIINAFLFKLPSSSGGKGTNRSRESIVNRLSELRSRPDDDTRNPSHPHPQPRPEDDIRTDAQLNSEAMPGERPGPPAQRQLNPWPAQTSGGDEEGENLVQGMAMDGSASDGSLTPRSLRYLISDPKPEIKLLHRFKPGQGPRTERAFWRSFTDKCRLAWDVFFPPEPTAIARRKSAANAMSTWGSGGGSFGRIFQSRSKQFGGGGRSSGDGTVVNGLTAKQVVLSRLQMVLIADRCGVAPEHLLEMKSHTLNALAEYMGKDLDDDMSQLEVQVSALKPNGERLTMTIGFADMLGEEQLRDPIEYHYEQFEDDDDYFTPEEDGEGVADIAEAPTAGLKAARVRATPVPGGGEGAAAKGGGQGEGA
ncbi:hypothetical protein VaNZ11_014194 [Volvox africanus]|uniref:Uncharacterized protein n=1 Tax=Volvox africanus TaxID=51714 RepID=A0ABQ5SHY8_9CHLO|nr:hypothetical protein VaNZ11_014194 [Volvox africanus]